MNYYEYPQIARWIQFPTALALFLVVPKDPESGAIYVYDRRAGVWYWVDFEDQKYSGYNLTDLDMLLEQCCLLRLVENPRLLRDREWFVTPGRSPLAVGASCCESRNGSDRCAGRECLARRPFRPLEQGPCDFATSFLTPTGAMWQRSEFVEVAANPHAVESV